MEGTMMITLSHRKAMAQLHAGVITTISPVAEIALGDGGVDEAGKPLVISTDREELFHEVCRYPVATPVYPKEGVVRFLATIPKEEHGGATFNEMALVAADGKVIALKTMHPKQKDGDVEFTFAMDLEF